MDILTDLFDRVGFKTNVLKTKAKVMTCVDARIRVWQSDEVNYRTTCVMVSESARNGNEGRWSAINVV